MSVLTSTELQKMKRDHFAKIARLEKQIKEDAIKMIMKGLITLLEKVKNE